jgi:hypothetical protein
LTAFFYPLPTRNVIEPRHYEGCKSRKDDDNQTTKDRIAHLSKTLAAPTKGREDILHDIAAAELPEMVHHSTAVENSTLRLEDAEKILTTGIVPKELSTREVYEAKNKAKRQTIPAFRLREKWMISEAYREKVQ